ncbi:MAG TPA: hypothetical protein VJQ83_01075 [Tepidiformaceae bacterium]|nr:hypothetical protein [Tepidiformaceae bacterium]
MAYREGSANGHMDGDRVERIEATQMLIDRSAVRYLHTEEAQVERAAVQRMRAKTADMNQAAIGKASFERGTIRQSTAGIVVGRSVACDEVRTGILVAPVVRGDVHTWLDMRSAVAIGFGIALGRLAIGAVRGLGRRIAG